MKLLKVNNIIIVIISIIIIITIILKKIEYNSSITFGGVWLIDQSKPSFISEIYDNLLVVELFLGTRKVNMIIDTGSTDSYLTSNILKELTVLKYKIPFPVFLDGYFFNIKFMKRVNIQEPLKIGSYLGTEMDWLVIEEKSSYLNSLMSEGFHIDGIIGRNILNNFKMYLDFEKHKLILQSSESRIAFCDGNELITLPMNGRSAIPLSINNKNAMMLIDTGALVFIIMNSIGLNTTNVENEMITIYNFNKTSKEKYKKIRLDAKIGDLPLSCYPVFENKSLKNIFAYRKISAGMQFISLFNWIFDFRKNKVTIIGKSSEALSKLTEF